MPSIGKAGETNRALGAVLRKADPHFMNVGTG